MRLNPVNRETTDTKTAKLLDAVEKKLGILPNMVATMAQSSAVANAYLGFSSALAGGQLSASTRESIALAVGQKNRCDYCVAAHSAIGAGAGLDEAALVAARRSNSDDPKTDAILKFSTKLVENQGLVTDEEVSVLKSHGITEGEIGEVIANVALNIFTNYFNHVAETEVDFPEPAALPVTG